MKNDKCKMKNGFSLVELIVVVVIIGILSGVAYVGIQKAKSKTMNDKVLDDVIGIANALERYNQDHFGVYPVPDVDGNMNISCFYADATYAHDCDTSAFRQGMIDNNLLTRRYMPEVPTDPRTGSRYVYGVSTDGKYFMVGGNYEESSGSFVAKTSGNLKKGYHLPSLLRAFNGPNFVTEDGTNLPYSPDHLIITAALRNIDMTGGGSVLINNDNSITVTDGYKVTTGDIIKTVGNATLDIYYSDGSISNLDASSEMEILEGTEVEENDEDGIITKIRIKLTSGKIWNKVARLASASEFNVETTTAIAGVRGTEFGVDADANQVLLKSGEICRLNLGADILVDEIKDCTGVNVLDELTIGPTDNPKSIAMNAGSGATAGDADASPDLKILMTENSKRYLNDNIAPHILKIEEGGVITVANLGTYYSLPELVDLEADGLGIYIDGVFVESKLLSIIETDPGGDYEYAISPIPTTSFVLRFVDDIGPDSGDSIPITITADTFLTEEDLYRVDEEVGEGVVEEEGCVGVPEIAGYVQAVPNGADFDITLNWSVTPDCVFDGDTNYAITFQGQSDAVVVGETQKVIGTISAGDHDWSVTASGVDGDPSFSETYATPVGDTWCGDGVRQMPNDDGFDEQCEYNASVPGIGCIMTSADACTCASGWTPQSISESDNYDCVCDETGAEITLTDYTDPIPINSSLQWSVSPACAFEGEDYSVYVGTSTLDASDIIGGGPLTYFSLIGAGSHNIAAGNTYDWKIIGGGKSSPVGSFEVECPADPEIIVLNTPKASYPDTDILYLHTINFSWETSEPACRFNTSAKYSFTIEEVITGECDQQVIGTSLTLNSTCRDKIESMGGGDFTWSVSRATNTLPTNGLAISDDYGAFTVTAPATPAPVFTSPLVINCDNDPSNPSIPPEPCMTDSTYTVNFEVENAISCSANTPPSPEVIIGSGEPGSVSDITINPDDTASFTFDTAGTSIINTIQITVNCDGPGGPDISDSIDVYLEF